jgi:hypothetical protein
LVADPKAKKWLTEKRLILAGQKISLLALHTASLELDSGLPVKSRKIDFLRKFLKNKKILGLMLTKKNLYRIALKIDTHFWDFRSGLRRKRNK